MVRAAGAVVARDGRILVIHRPKHDDWGFPKGKLEPGEDEVAAAVREVEEEVGLAVELGEQLGEAHYTLRDGTPKRVVYFLARPEGQAEPGDGVDELRWVTPEDAACLLTYPHDRQLVAQL